MNAFKDKRILIVEDSSFFSKMTAGILSKHGYKAEIAMTGKEAVEKVRSSHYPDLILMDIELGEGMDGVQTARMIQQFADIPIVFFTAHTEKEIMKKISSVTGYGYVLKGADENVLVSTVEMALRLYEANARANMYRQILENSLNEIYIFHPETLRFIEVNHGARKNTGYTMKELSAMTPLDLKPEIDLQSLREMIDSLAGGHQEKIVFNTLHCRKDGSFYPVEVHLQMFEHREEKLCAGLVIDLTERREIEEELRARESTLNAIMSSAMDAIIMLDSQGNAVFWNPAAEQLFGYSSEEVLGKEFHRLVVLRSEQYEDYEKAFSRFQLTGEGNAVGKRTELKAKHKDGHELDVELSLSALKIRGAWHAVGIVRDITERKKAQEQVYKLSITDTLTNAYNRRYFTQKLEEEIERAKRAGRKFSLIMLDIDRFKSVNDRFGHNAGDLVLKSMAEMIKNRIRKIDTLARWGGEEFVILLPETTVNKAAVLAEELRQSLSRMEIPGVGSVTASFGVACYCPGDTIDALMQRTDGLMYEAKSAGRNCVRYMHECE